jgi:hypothetical protein
MNMEHWWSNSSLLILRMKGVKSIQTLYGQIALCFNARVGVAVSNIPQYVIRVFVRNLSMR